MTLYHGIDVLDQVEPSREGDRPETFNRPFSLVDYRTGSRSSFTAYPAPANERSMLWVCHGRAQIEVLKDFIVARRGRVVPFWVPSFQRDLRPAENLLAASTQMVIQRIGYSLQMFPGSGGRRHVALWPQPGAPAVLYRRITGATDSGGSTESLVVDTAWPAGYQAAAVMVSFLLLCRLAKDRVRIDYLTNDIARAEIPITEIPLEAPTS